MELNKIYNEDCLVGMKRIPDKSIDMILCDLPYGTTGNSWDNIIPFNELWKEYERIITNEGAIVLTANSSFTNKIISSNEKLYRYKWIWVKNTVTNPMNAKNRPMVSFEEILVFSKNVTANATTNKMNYFPQGLIRLNKKLVGKRKSQYGGHIHEWNAPDTYTQEFTNYPKDVLFYDVDPDRIHPTQKPVSLFEYLIKTYTNKGDIVLDNCMGSATTAVACMNTDRNFIGFEKEKSYFELGNKRIAENTKQLNLLEV